MKTAKKVIQRKTKTTAKKGVKFYDESYFSERNSAMPHVKDALFNVLKDNHVKTILEVAPGAGDLMRNLKKKGYKVTGIDISPTAAKLSGSIVGSATDLPFKDESFDCVLGLSIIEHLSEKDGEKFAREAFRVLKKRGIYFLLTPNYFSPMRKILGKKWYGYSDPTHIYFYTPFSLTKLLEKCGFNNVTTMFRTTAVTMDWPFPAAFQKLSPSWKKLLNVFMISTPVSFIRDSLWIVGQKK